MTLALPLFDRRYDQLVELGRAQIPGLAPEWTDHNAHDPGIMLLELLAFVAEAQLYSLGRMRRDERLAYAALLGIAPHGTREARGVLWPDRADLTSPAATFEDTRVIEREAIIRLAGQEAPLFHPERKMLWVAGGITRLWSRLANGQVVELRAMNDRGTAFFPFGEEAGPQDVLTMAFETRGETGLFPLHREAEDATLVVGVQAAEDAAAFAKHAVRCEDASLAVTLVTEDGVRHPLRVLADSTAGLLRTGVLHLDVSQVPESPARFAIEIRAPHGFVRPPRWRRIELNVVPITSREAIEREQHEANGLPDFQLTLEAVGLCFEPGTRPIRVEVQDEGELREWTLRDRLADHGPQDRVFELDVRRGRVRFGNGLNGRRPSKDAQIYVSYEVSPGADANVARNRRWTVEGFPGVFGMNPDAVLGGGPCSEDRDLRRLARAAARDGHALVSETDIVSAALALPLLGVARAWVVPPDEHAPSTGTVTLIVVRARPNGLEPAEPPETRRWLAAVRNGLAPRLPLGSRLQVVGPRYVDVHVRAEVEIERGRDPRIVADAVGQQLGARLAVVSAKPGAPVRMPGVPLGRAEVAAWIRSVDGVVRIARLGIFRDGRPLDRIRVGRDALIRVDPAGPDIVAKRPEPGSTP